MEQLTYAGAADLRWEESPAPVLDSDLAALVRPLAVATCDLDALIVAGISPFKPPFALGHECVAEVVEIGDGVGRVRPGQRVSVPFQISCGSCDACRRGRTSNCLSVPRASTYGFGPHVGVWGGFLADLALVPYADHMLVELPPGVEPAAAASASDNLGDGWRAVGPQLEREPGAPVLVVGGFGPGSIGLYAAALAVALGSERVLYADDDDGRCQVAEAVGAEVLRPPWPRRVGPFPITVDARGHGEALAFALRSTAPDGSCTSTAIYFGEPPALPLLEMYEKVMSFSTGRSHARRAIPPVLALIAQRALRPELVTTRAVPWGEAAEALVEPGWAKLVFERESSGA